jgi:hypothetical protein
MVIYPGYFTESGSLMEINSTSKIKTILACILLPGIGLDP